MITEAVTTGQDAVDPTLYRVPVLGKRGGTEYLTAMEVAQEAVQLQTQDRRLKHAEQDFAAHMMSLAAQCGEAQEFDALMRSITLKMGWGRKNPAPKRFTVYRSTLFRAMKDFGLVPQQEATLPVMKGGAVLVDEHGAPRRETIKLESFGQLRAAMRASRTITQQLTGTPLHDQPLLSAGMQLAMVRLAQLYHKLGEYQRMELLSDIEHVMDGYEREEPKH